MTVRELISQLIQEDLNSEVVIIKSDHARDSLLTHQDRGYEYCDIKQRAFSDRSIRSKPSVVLIGERARY
jgi:hypothetical protein